MCKVWVCEKALHEHSDAMALVVQPVTGVLFPQAPLFTDPVGALPIALVGRPFAFVLVPLGPILIKEG
jgi:hypothetical protein